MKTRTATPHVSVAALSVDLAGGGNAPAEFRLLPYGRFRAADGSGRPAEVADGWLLTPEGAAALAAAFAARTDARVIDYDHQTLRAEANGKPAPAAGWIGRLEVRDDGLYAVDVEWTAAAAAMIAAREYRYVSPVFAYDKATGEVLAVVHAALVNYAGLDGLTDLAALAALVSPSQPTQEPYMDDLLEQLRWMLNLPVGATVDDVKAQLQKLIDQLKAEPSVAAAGGLAQFVAGHATAVAALQAAAVAASAVDPAKYVEIAVLSATQSDLATARTELAALRADIAKGELDGVIVAALSDGRLTPAQEVWARDLGGRDIAALTGYLATVQPAVVPGKTQSGGVAPAAPAGASGDPQVIAQAALSYQLDQARAGVVVTTPQAVAHVMAQQGGAAK